MLEEFLVMWDELLSEIIDGLASEDGAVSAYQPILMYYCWLNFLHMHNYMHVVFLKWKLSHDQWD